MRTVKKRPTYSRFKSPGPMRFRCAACRRAAKATGSPIARKAVPEGGGYLRDVRLTGRQFPISRNPGENGLSVEIQYECRTCGHVGKSNHKDLADKVDGTPRK